MLTKKRHFSDMIAPEQQMNRKKIKGEKSIKIPEIVIPENKGEKKKEKKKEKKIKYDKDLEELYYM